MSTTTVSGGAVPSRFSRFSPRRAAVLVPVGYAAVVVAMFWRVFTRGQMSGWDCAVQHWPDLLFQFHAIGDGEIPLWNPHMQGGYGFWADPHSGMWSPLHWLLWVGSLVAGDGPWLIQAKVLLLFWLGLCGMHVWMWRRSGSHVAAATAALTWIVGSPLLVHKNSAVAWPLLWLPWTMWAFDLFVDRPTARRGAILAAALWMVSSAGNPPGFFYALLILAAYGAVRLALVVGPWRTLPRRLKPTIPGVATACGLTALLSAIVWVPASAVVAESSRAERGAEYVLSGSMTPAALDELWAPNVDGNWAFDVYVGGLPIVAALWLAFAARRGRPRAEAWLWIALGAFGIDLALGSQGHALPWLGAHVPGFGLFRIAYRYKLVFGFAAAAAAGDAVARLAEDLPARWRGAWLVGSAGWIIGAARVQIAWPSTVVVAGVLVVLGMAWWRRGRSALLLAVPPLVFLDLWSAGAIKLAILQRVPDLRPVAAQVAALAGAEREWRYHVGNPSSPYGGTVPYHVAPLAELRELSGYPNPLQSKRHAEILERARRRPELLRHFNVRYFAGHRGVSGGTRVAPGIVAVDDVAPLARWYGAIEILPSARVLDRLATVGPSELRAAIVAQEDVAGRSFGSLSSANGELPVDGKVVSYRRNRLAVALVAPAPGVVVVNEAFADGWKASWVDAGGKRVALPVFRAHHHLRAVLVPGGAGRLEMEYCPSTFVPLALGFLLGLVGVIAVGVGPWRWLDRWPRGPGAPGEPRDQVPGT